MLCSFSAFGWGSSGRAFARPLFIALAFGFFPCCAGPAGQTDSKWLERSPPRSFLKVGGGGSFQAGSAPDAEGDSGLLGARIRGLSGADGGQAHLFLDAEGEAWAASDATTGFGSAYSRAAGALGFDPWPDTTGDWVDIRLPFRVGAEWGLVEFGQGVELKLVTGFLGVEPEVLLARFGQSEISGFASFELGIGSADSDGAGYDLQLARYDLGFRWKGGDWLVEASYAKRDLEFEFGTLAYDGGFVSVGFEW